MKINRYINKTIACLLAASLLTPNLLFASANGSAAGANNQKQSLAQYQKQVKEDLKKAPWLSREGVGLLTVGGCAVGLLVAQHIYYSRKNELLKTQLNNQNILNKKLSEIYNIESAQQQKTINELLEQQKYLQKQLRHQTNIAEGFKEARKTWAEQKSTYKSTIESLQNRFAMKKDHYMDLVRYSTDLDKEFAKYEKLFDKNLSVSDRMLLRAELTKEPWLLAATPAQQKEFLKIVDKASMVAAGAGKLSGTNYMRFLIRDAIDRNMPLYERLIGLCRHVFHSKNVMTIGIFLALGLSARNANAQSMGNRIQDNFNLFINATPAELAQMEKDPEVRDICIQGAEALHTLSKLDEQGASFLKKGLSVNPAINKSKQLRYTTNHLSR